MIEATPWTASVRTTKDGTRREKGGDGSDEYVVAELAAGRAVQFNVMDYRKLKAWRDEQFPMADVWYTERNGDPIAMWVPKGTPAEELPEWALEYMAIEWIDPDKDFGTGYRPLRWR
jgi:hypothetical protein